MRIGYHCEGKDKRVLHRLTCRLLDVDEDATTAESTRQEDISWPELLKMAHDSVVTLLSRGMDLIIVVADNDGSPKPGCGEDPEHPRHWLHTAAGAHSRPGCRCCDLVSAATVPGKSPVVVCVAVEAIEAWLIVARGIAKGNPEDLSAESRGPGVALKLAFYGRKRVPLSRVTRRAVPLVKALPDIRQIGLHSRSFRMFMDDIDAAGEVLRSTGVLPSPPPAPRSR